jgi:hypothetical protein
LRVLVARALELTQLKAENVALRQELGQRYAPDRIVAESKKTREVLELVRGTR